VLRTSPGGASFVHVTLAHYSSPFTTSVEAFLMFDDHNRLVAPWYGKPSMQCRRGEAKKP